jgi:hypothetical protein
MTKFHCDRCFYETDRKDLLIKHLKKIKPCNITNFNIERSTLLNNLNKLNIDTVNNKIYKCKYCNKEYINRSSKGMHQQKCKLNNENQSNMETINNFSNNIIIKKREELELKKIELELLRINNQINNEKNNKQNIVNENYNDIIKDELSIIDSNNNIVNSNNNNTVNNTINNIINSNNTVNNINTQYNIKTILANNPNILPFTRYDVSLLYSNNGEELKNIIEYSKNNNSNFINNFLQKLYFNEKVQSNLNLYYDINNNKIIIKLADGITHKYNVEEVIIDIMKQMKDVLKKINNKSYEIKNINKKEYDYIDVKLEEYNIDNNNNYTFIVNLIKENEERIKNVPLIFDDNKTKNEIIRSKTNLRRPVDLRMDGPIDFNDTTRFVEYEYRNKKFYWDNPNDTLYEFRTKKFFGQRKSYVNRLNGYDTDGEPLPDEQLSIK